MIVEVLDRMSQSLSRSILSREDSSTLLARYGCKNTPVKFVCKWKTVMFHCTVCESKGSGSNYHSRTYVAVERVRGGWDC